MKSENKSEEMVYVAVQAVSDFVRKILVGHGVPDEDAQTVADCLVRADLRGLEIHGTSRLPLYLERLRRGLINPQPDIEVKQVTPVAVSVDGHNGFGYVVATRAMDEAIAMAKTFGIGIASVRRSTHFGVAASYVLQAVKAGFLSLVFTNAPPAMPPWGGLEPILGTSPFAAGAPGGNGDPIVLDMSPAVITRGKIRRAEQRDETIPLGCALDVQGLPTTDPIAASKGVVLPIGGPKGSGLAILMDIFSGIISGAAYAGDVGDHDKDFDRPQNVGHFFLAMKPDLFVSEAEYRGRIETLARRLRNCSKAIGYGEIMLPGEPEARHEQERRTHGIPYHLNEINALQAEAAKVGVPPLELSNNPI